MEKLFLTRARASCVEDIDIKTMRHLERKKGDE
jgi:hypothetical protein